MSPETDAEVGLLSDNNLLQTKNVEQFAASRCQVPSNQSVSVGSYRRCTNALLSRFLSELT